MATLAPVNIATWLLVFSSILRSSMTTICKKVVFVFIALSWFLMSGSSTALAQVTAPKQSDASAQRGSVLPYPPPPFKGIIGRTTADSKSYFELT